MKKCVAALAALSSMLSSAPSWADTAAVPAKLIDISGSVLVDGVPYKGGPLKPGDVIRAVGDGKATLAYADGCDVAVTRSSSVIVRVASTCVSGINGTAAGTEGVGSGIGGSAPLVPGGVIGIGGGVLALGGALAVAAAAHSKPASP
jgi:hypothetical protein